VRRLALLATTTVLSSLVVVPSAQAAVDYFLEIDGVAGESQDAQHANSIDVLSYTWGAAGGGGSGRPQLQDLQIVKSVDVASPVLFERLVQGANIPSMELLGRKTGASSQDFLRYCFQGVRVSSTQQADSRGSAAPTESVSFSYNAVSQQYVPQRPDGSLGASVFAGWDAVNNQLIATYPNPCGA
jgi:type VI secretion system secreted protein Hcp